VLSRYHQHKIISLSTFSVIYFLLGDLIGLDWVFVIVGFIFPWIELSWYKSDYWQSFPWELYLFYAYLFIGFFVGYDDVFVYAGCGFSLARFLIYFLMRENKQQ